MRRIDPSIVTAVTAVTATHPICGELRFELARQDQREYFRLLYRREKGWAGTGSLTDATHAVQTVEYWRAKKWTA